MQGVSHVSNVGEGCEVVAGAQRGGNVCNNSAAAADAAAAGAAAERYRQSTHVNPLRNLGGQQHVDYPALVLESVVEREARAGARHLPPLLCCEMSAWASAQLLSNH